MKPKAGASQCTLTLILLLASSRASANTSDLNAAFVAAFAQPVPMQRQINMPRRGADARPDAMTLSLVPETLVALGGNQFALLVTETTTTLAAEGVSLDALAVAYLHHNGAAWTLDKVWFEVGGPGFAGNAKRELRNFGRSPLYFTTKHWCGSNACSDLIEALSLNPLGPQVLGEIKGGASYPTSFPKSGPTDCESAFYTATVGPPAAAADPFSITYRGWTSPPGRLLPKRVFARTADVMTNGPLLHTNLHTPDCMR